ncbi:hypothetical protein, partial [Streptomyces anulatus]|uniref:hypothetical protein n=1 Tax=Streptomyces anulatus TaxID=1892 RepID=UPI0034250F5B
MRLLEVPDGARVSELERSAEPKRTALLTAVVRSLEAAAIDDAEPATRSRSPAPGGSPARQDGAPSCRCAGRRA